MNKELMKWRVTSLILYIIFKFQHGGGAEGGGQEAPAQASYEAPGAPVEPEGRPREGIGALSIHMWRLQAQVPTSLLPE
jgi:hypothetical protein